MSSSELSGGDLDGQWHVLQGREILGPFSGHAICGMVRDRTIGPDARVAPLGAAEWQPLHVLTDQAEPPAMTSGATSTTTSAAGRRRYAGFWIRVGAYLIDTLIVNVVVFVITFGVFFVLGAAMAMKTGNGDALNRWIADHKIYLNLIGLTFWFVYETLFVGGPWQATPGKRICNIHVVRDTGARLGYGRALARYLCYFIDSLILLIGFMMAGWTEEKTALHDLMCGTRVLYGRPQPAHARTVAGTF